MCHLSFNTGIAKGFVECFLAILWNFYETDMHYNIMIKNVWYIINIMYLYVILYKIHTIYRLIVGLWKDSLNVFSWFYEILETDRKTADVYDVKNNSPTM